MALQSEKVYPVYQTLCNVNTIDLATTELVRLNHAEWRVRASEFADYTYRHLWEFGTACAERQGFENEFIAVTRSGRVISLAHVRIKRIFGLPIGIAYINGGPLIRKGDDPLEGLAETLEALKDFYVKRQKLVLRIQPPFADPEWNERQAAVYLGSGFRDLKRGYQTILLDLRLREEEIRMQLAQKWRNRLNRALRSEIRVVNRQDDAAFQEFCRLYDILLERKQFETDLEADFYYRVHRQLCEADRFGILLAYMDDVPVAGYVYSLLGHCGVLLLGASTQAGMMHSASNLLQWHLIRTLKNRGGLWYDIGGIDPQDNPGVYQFKKGLRGIEVTVPGPFECSPDPIRNGIIRLGVARYQRRKKSTSSKSRKSNG